MLNPVLISGMVVVTLALGLYTTAFCFELRLQKASKSVLFFFTSGLILDITSTTLMIVGSRRIPITPHGFLGYSALSVMIADVILLYRHKHKSGSIKLSKNLHYYSFFAYCWWLIAYIAGGLLVAMTRK